MTSPFPGMDPYLEGPGWWPGFHTGFIVALLAAMNRILPEGYFASLEQQILLEDEDVGIHDPMAIADVFISEGFGSTAVATRPAKTSKATGELRLDKPLKRRIRRYLTVVDQQDRRVVTVIEVLSPSNKKPGKDRDSYLLKREEYIASGLNFVEMDLLRAGPRMPIGQPAPERADYYIMVSRARQFPKVSYWAFSVRDPLPVIPIPLKPQDGEIALPLRPCLDRIFEDANYRNQLNYSKPLPKPLKPDDAKWAATLTTAPSRKRSP